jgi:mRNA-degrading endonuclease RelE of RelBE toxin-antitoxin system
MSVAVLLAKDAQADYEDLPATIQARVNDVIERLKQWPNVSGAKPLRREWSGHFRIRTGDWRVIFRPVTPCLLVVRIKHRSEVYED